MLTEVSHPPAKLLEEPRQGEQGVGEQELSQAEASPARAAELGWLDPRSLLMHGWPLSAREKVPIWHKEEDTVFQAIVCASPILLTPQLLVKRNEYI